MCETDNENLIDGVLKYMITIKDHTALHKQQCDTSPQGRSIIQTTINDILSITLDKSVPEVSDIICIQLILIFIP